MIQVWEEGDLKYYEREGMSWKSVGNFIRSSMYFGTIDFWRRGIDFKEL
jgi:hypothetical protein